MFIKIVDAANIELAHHNARKGKRHYRAVQMVDRDLDKYLGKIREMLVNQTFTTSQYRYKTIYDSGKIRDISRLPYYPDRIVQHAVMNVIQPLWDKVFIYDCYSAVPGKGIHLGLRRLRSFLRDKENTLYCLKFDIRKYYPSINHNILLEQLTRKIKCPDTLWLLEDVIRSPGGDTGIPIGNYLSQYFANIYLNWFDHWLKEDQRCRYYLRYCDDGVILDASKPRLRTLLKEITDYLTELKLKLNPKTQIFPVDTRGVDFLGYRSFRNYTLLRRYSAKRLKHKVKNLEKHVGELEPQSVVSSVMSYIGWIKHCDGHHFLSRYITRNQAVMKAMDKASISLNIRNPLWRLT